MPNNILQRSKRISAVIIILLCLPMTAFSAASLDAGVILDSLPGNKILPTKEPELSVNIEEQQLPAIENEIPIMVKSIRITGQTICNEDELLPLFKTVLGKQTTLHELENICGRIGKYFHTKGYFLANAVIPAQEIKDGVVEINVIVGQYGKIDIRNHSSLKQKIYSVS